MLRRKPVPYSYGMRYIIHCRVAATEPPASSSEVRPMDTEAQEIDTEAAREVTIVINGRRVKTDKNKLTFDEVVALSGMPTGPDIVFTITYRRGHGDKREGSMVEGGEPVKVKDGMIFNVDSTNRS